MEGECKISTPGPIGDLPTLQGIDKISGGGVVPIRTGKEFVQERVKRVFGEGVVLNQDQQRQEPGGYKVSE